MIKLSAINQRRLQNFKNNKRGYISFLIFMTLFLISIFAEFVANDKPILVKYKNDFYFPIFKSYAETEFGGQLETIADYKDPFVQKLIDDNGFAIWPVIKYSYNTVNYDLPVPAPSPPDFDNLLGTDDQARDVLARSIYGFRLSVIFALLLTFFSSIIGIAAGSIQGYFGGKIDLIFQRVIEIWQGLPSLFMLIILASIIVPNFWWILFIMLLFSWTYLVGIVRAEFLKARNLEYVKAAKALGVSEIIIIFRHILPNALISTLSLLPFILTGAITALATLDFLGFGLPPGSPSLGEMLAQGKANLQAPWLAINAFIVLTVTLSLLIFIGEAVRDGLDPNK